MPNDLVLYRFFDSDGCLLYVGQSINPWRRLSEHGKGLVRDGTATVTLERVFSNLDELRRAEAVAIMREQPRHNVNLKGRPQPARPPAGTTCEAGQCVGLAKCRKSDACGCCERDRYDAVIVDRVTGGESVASVSAALALRPELIERTCRRVVARIVECRASGEPVPVIAETLGVSRATLYRLLAEEHRPNLYENMYANRA